MKRIHIIIYSLIILIWLKIIVTFFINESFISDYNAEKYDMSKAKTLTSINFLESYAARYNYGNTLYKNNNFDGAIEEYKKALSLFPPKKKECAIRINLSLAMLKKMNLEDESDKNKTENLNILKEAREVLCENGCANRNDDNGHSEEAEKLKKDIDKMINELQNKKDEKSDKNEEQEKEEQEKTEEQKQEEQKKKEKEKISNAKQEKLKEIQSESLKVRQEELEQYKYSVDYDYYGGKNW